jgi:hypothetical protein
MTEFINLALHACYERKLTLGRGDTQEHVNPFPFFCNVHDPASFIDRCNTHTSHGSLIETDKYELLRTYRFWLSKVAVDALGKMTQMAALDAINIL